MEHKTFELIDVKADGDAGTFTALASVFGNVDRVGDKMLPGSFTKTLETWRQSGKPLPVILSHNWDDPHKYVGEADPRAVYESDQGLVVQGKMYADEPLGKKVYELMKNGILTGWSFGYKVPKGGQQKKDGVNEISEVELFEVGPTLVGANPDAQLQEIKSDLGIEDKAEAGDNTTNYDPKPEDTEPEPIAAEEVVTLEAHEKALDEMRNEFEGDMAELREAIEILQTEKTSEGRRNEEPKRAKSPPDPLMKASREAVMAVHNDGLTAEDKRREPDPEPEPEIDDRELRRQGRRAVLSALKGDTDGD